MWSEESIIGFDTETTGIRPKKDRLVTRLNLFILIQR